MKRFVVIGLGNFGSSIARALYAQGHEIVALDISEAVVDDIASHVSRAAVGDGRENDVLDELGAGEADVGVVSTGDDITSSILATMSLQDLGVEDIYVKVISTDHARAMQRIGATETIFPERQAAENLAARLVQAESILNYVRLGPAFSIQEMAVPNEWIGKSLRELNVRASYGVTVIAIHDVLTDHMNPVPDPSSPLKDSDTLLVAGTKEKLAKVAEIP
jgi:trk system potassium uptake protein TrkA